MTTKDYNCLQVCEHNSYCFLGTGLHKYHQIEQKEDKRKKKRNQNDLTCEVKVETRVESDDCDCYRIVD